MRLARLPGDDGLGSSSGQQGNGRARRRRREGQENQIGMRAEQTIEGRLDLLRRSECPFGNLIMISIDNQYSLMKEN